MESRLKERLTGAAILVALIVLIVPEVFRGGGQAPAARARGTQAPAAAAPAAEAKTSPETPAATEALAATASEAPSATEARAASTGAAAPTRTVTIDLSQGTAVPAGVSTGTPAASAPAAAPEAPAATARAAGAAPAGQAHAAAKLTAPARASTARAPAARVPTATPAKASARTPPVAGAAARPGGWAVQLGLFASSTNAQRLQRTARQHGFHARVDHGGPHGLYRVWLGSLADRAAAEQLAHRVHAAGLAALIVRP